jgi:DNA (cytosine-5)-methyltransferase 1
MEKKIVELFAGVGGFHLGFQKSSSDWDVVWANQWEPSRKAQDAFNCYVEKFGKKDIYSNEDIGSVDKNKIPGHSLLVGGFPCQDYSVASTGAKGIHGKKGVLWWEIRDILEAKKPPFVLLENVDRLLKSPAKQRGRDFGVILKCFDDLGYSVEWRVINAAEYGFSQRRRRIFIYAFKNTTKFHEKLDNNDMKNWLHKDGFFQSQFPIKEEIKTAASGEFNDDDLVKVSDEFSFTFMNTGIMSSGAIYTEHTFPLYDGERVLLGDILEKDVDERFYLGENLDDWKYMKGAKKIERVSKTGHSYTFSEGPIAFPDPIDRPGRTMLTSEASKNRSTHIIEDPQTKRLRKLTPMECERLNGFEDDWTNTGMSERFRYFTMGNALVVDLVKKMGDQLNIIFENEK